ncbi:hypothetical protein [Nonomuraea sp. NPDC049709]|uniref:hypothetical protein n=1 Tax=Nonomuraea sp. NPDC049709 TaxID=3154736 RepID=UPI00341F4BFF
MPDSTDPGTIAGILAALREQVVRALRAFVDRSPAEALTWLLAAAAEVPAEGSVGGNRYVLTLQVVYACLLARGPIPVFWPPADLDPGWAERLSDLAAALVALSSVLLDLDPGTCTRCELGDGHLTLHPADRVRWALEVNLYGAASLVTDPPENAARVDAVEDAAFGVSASRLLGILLDPASGLGDVTRIIDQHGLVHVDLGPPTPIVQALRRYAVLNPPRWRDRAVPSFLFADTRPAHRTDDDLVVTASEADWLCYAPLLCGGYVEDGRPTVVGVTSRGLLQRAYGRAQGSIANRLHQAQRAARARSHDLGREVDRLARAVHADLEQDAAERCRSAGMSAVHGLERLGGRPLPCGEIDVLAQATGPDGGLVVLVGECKNVDLTFYKGRGVAQAEDTLRQAADQVRRKSAWVARTWPAAARALGSPPDPDPPCVVAVVVTRIAAFPSLPDGVPVLPLRELAGFARTLARTPAEQWWPVLRLQRH